MLFCSLKRRQASRSGSAAESVARATKEQKLGSESVVSAMGVLDKISEENLRLSAELKRFSEESSYEVENLLYSISSFRIHSDGKRCWLIEGTWCRGAQQGDFRAKLKNCITCEAFRVIQGIDVR